MDWTLDISGLGLRGIYTSVSRFVGLLHGAFCIIMDVWRP